MAGGRGGGGVGARHAVPLAAPDHPLGRGTAGRAPTVAYASIVPPTDPAAAPSPLPDRYAMRTIRDAVAARAAAPAGTGAGPRVRGSHWRTALAPTASPAGERRERGKWR